MRFSSALALSLLALAVPTSAQTVHLTVVDAESGLPVAAAAVAVRDGAEVGAREVLGGRAEMPIAWFDGRTMLVVSAEGYLSSAPMTLPSAADAEPLLVFLSPRGTDPTTVLSRDVENDEVRAIVGLVLDGGSRNPVPTVEVLVDSLSTTVTDADGRFSIPDIAPGGYLLTFRRIGFADHSVEVTVDPESGGAYVRTRMRAEAVALGPIEVAAIPRRTVVQAREIQHRIQLGIGRFVTAENLERRGYPDALTIFTNLPNVTWDQGVPVFRRAGRLMGRPCPPVFYLDGIKTRDSPAMLRGMSGLDIELVEAYDGAANMPAEFSGSDARCGVVAIWTRRGVPLSELLDLNLTGRSGG